MMNDIPPPRLPDDDTVRQLSGRMMVAAGALIAGLGGLCALGELTSGLGFRQVLRFAATSAGPVAFGVLVFLIGREHAR